MKSFLDKTAVITGAGSGIGRSLAVQLNRAGAQLALCDWNQESLTETQDLLENKAVDASTHLVDISDQAQVAKFAAEAVEQYGGVDLLINNAGIVLAPTPVEELSDTQFEQVINVNMWGTYYVTRAFLPHLKAQPEACIVTVSSLAGLIGLSGYGPYAMSKFAGRAFSESLAMELSDTQVHVLVVHPGGVKTNLIKNASNLSPDEVEKAHRAFVGAAMLTPDQAAAKILRAVQRKRRRQILGWDARIAYAVRRLFPQSYVKMLNYVFGYMRFR